jgi:hypothetical protein
LHDDLGALVFAFVEIEQTVHAAIRAFAFAFFARTRFDERARPMLESKLVN